MFSPSYLHPASAGNAACSGVNAVVETVVALAGSFAENQPAVPGEAAFGDEVEVVVSIVHQRDFFPRPLETVPHRFGESAFDALVPQDAAQGGLCAARIDPGGARRRLIQATERRVGVQQTGDHFFRRGNKLNESTHGSIGIAAQPDETEIEHSLAAPDFCEIPAVGIKGAFFFGVVQDTGQQTVCKEKTDAAMVRAVNGLDAHIATVIVHFEQDIAFHYSTSPSKCWAKYSHSASISSSWAELFSGYLYQPRS